MADGTTALVTQVHDEGDATRVALSGKLTTMTAPGLDELLEGLPFDRDVALDLSQLDYMASAGLRTIIASGKRAAAAGVGFYLLDPTPEVMEILDMTGLADVLDIRHGAGAGA